jgi:hypothetical protein
MTSALPLRLGKIFLAGGLAAGAAWWFTQNHTAQVSSASIKPSSLLAHSPASPITPPSADATDDQLLRLARLQVARSPSQALAWIQSADPAVRPRLQRAILQAWGERDLPAATAWALNNETDPRADLRAALTGAMRDPSTAIQLGQQLLADNSPYSGTYGDALIDALGAAGQFQAALQFAAAAPADRQEDWLSAGFRNWAQQQPAQALQALDAITDPDLRDSVFRAIAQGWSGAEPSTLAAYALALPDDQRDYALNQSMFKWSQQDPVGLATWLVNVSPGPNYDSGAFFLLTENNAVTLGPATAMSWVQSIGDPSLQHSSFDRVLRQWTQADPSAARNYVENASWLQSEDRANALQNF